MEAFQDADRLQARLRVVLGATLPGHAAQALMSPRPRHGWRPGDVPEECRPAAALLLLYPRRGRVHLLLTQRTRGLSAHAGQLALPGGAVDPGETHLQAALREAREEVGLDPARVDVLGELTPLHIPASRFHLHPFVGMTARLGKLAPCDAEVARVLEVPLDELARGSNLHVESWELKPGTAEVPFFRVEGLELWGATAMVLAELLTVLGAPPDPWRETSRAEPSGGTLSDAGDAGERRRRSAPAPPPSTDP